MSERGDDRERGKADHGEFLCFRSAVKEVRARLQLGRSVHCGHWTAVLDKFPSTNRGKGLLCHIAANSKSSFFTRYSDFYSQQMCGIVSCCGSPVAHCILS